MINANFTPDNGRVRNQANEKDTAVLVAIINKNQPEEKVIEYLDELAFLAETLGLDVGKTFTQRMDKPEIRTFVGKGKLEEIRTYVAAENIKVVIFDDDLSPSQMRNLEKELQIKLYDRSLLILDIFLKRAQLLRPKPRLNSLARTIFYLG